jgi:Family of unknown function (DUF5723)
MRTTHISAHLRARLILFVVSLCIGVQFTLAQPVSRTGYFMDNATHRHLMNPALVPVRGYLSFPVVGAFSLGVESNMNLTKFIYPPVGDGELLTFMDKSIDVNDFLLKLSPNNYLRTDIRTSLLSMGFYAKNSFWTFDVAARTNISLNLPYDFFAFLKQGMNSSEGNEYTINDLSVAAGVFAEASLGYSRNIVNNLRIGTKLKLLVGGAYVKAGIDSMNINMTPDEWTINTVGKMEAYGKGLTLLTDENGSINGKFEMGTPGIGGKGLAFDLGINYSPIRNMDISLAVIDIGAIKWDQANITQARSSGQVSFSGISGLGMDSLASQSAEDQLKTIQDDMLKMADFKLIPSDGDILQRLFPTVNAGLEYSVLNNKISLGALYSNRFMLNERYSEITASLNMRPFRWFNLSGSYSFIQGKNETFGFALGFVPAIMNIYLACDYVFYNVSPQFIPLNTLTTNIQLGVSIPLGRGKLPRKH